MRMSLLLAFTLTAGSAVAQQAASPVSVVDDRFATWIGCWRLEDDLVGNGARMCITPEKNGVRMQTIAGTNRGIDELVIPDGTAHPVSDAECKGTERGEWSQDGLRLFRTTDVTCGNEPARTVRSLSFMANGSSWIHVQHVTSADATANVRVQRYRRATNQSLADGTKAPQPTAAALAASGYNDYRWSNDDIIEASHKVPAEGLQAALTEVKQPFEVNRKTLMALSKAQVAPEVIDLMIALTYPDKFTVSHQGGGGAPLGISTGTGWFDPFMSPVAGGMYADCFTPYGYGYRTYYSMCSSYYSPYMYSYFGPGYYPYYGGGGYGWVNVNPLPPINGGGGSVEVPPAGRVIAGHGYTQIRNREPEPAPRVSSGANGTAAGWSGNNSGGNVSSQGFSSGSSSSSGGSSSGGDSGARIAVPKGGGGQ